MAESSPAVPSAHEFREALVTEDDLLSTILYNAFLSVWNHNWFQGLSVPLPCIDAIHSPDSLSSLQRARVSFYCSLIKAIRLLQGLILVLSDDHGNIHAILLWLPPHRRLSISKLATLYQSGFLSTMLSYGLAGIHRVNFVFEGNVDKMFAQAGVRAEEYGFVQMLAANPTHQGNGSASRLLAWQMARHHAEHADVGVVLDTTTEAGVRAYKRLGFEEIGSMPVRAGTDSMGFLLRADATEEAKIVAEKGCVQRVMIRRR